MFQRNRNIERSEDAECLIIVQNNLPTLKIERIEALRQWGLGVISDPAIQERKSLHTRGEQASKKESMT